MGQANKEMSAIDGVREHRRLAENIRDSADQYLHVMESSPRPAVEVGGFYLTLDRSVVCVVRPHTRCTCPQCTGRSGGTMFGLPVMLLMPPGCQTADQVDAADDAEDAQPAHADGEQPREWVVSVIRGGHGIKNVRGEEPGDTYKVDAAGFSVLRKISDEQVCDVVTTHQLAIAGLSLWKRLSVHMSEVADVAQAAIV